MCSFVDPIIVVVIFALGMFAGLFVASLVLLTKRQYDKNTLASKAQRDAVLRATQHERTD